MAPIDALRDHALGPQQGAGRPPPLAEAAREFESLLLGTLLRTGSRPIGGRSLLDGGSAGRMYREMLFQELARKATERGGFGIQRLLDESPGAEARPEQTP